MADPGTETIVIEPDEPAVNRTPTKPIVASRLEVDLADPATVASFLDFAARAIRSAEPNAVAQFLEFAARIVRTKGRLTVTIE